MTETIPTQTEQPLVIFEPSCADESTTDTSSSNADCTWCGSKLTSIDGVCDRCYGLLVGAGVRDEEIFRYMGKAHNEDPKEDC